MAHADDEIDPNKSKVAPAPGVQSLERVLREDVKVTVESAIDFPLKLADFIEILS